MCYLLNIEWISCSEICNLVHIINILEKIKVASTFENGRFTLKTHQMFSFHTKPEKSENATITGHFGFLIE